MFSTINVTKTFFGRNIEATKNKFQRTNGMKKAVLFIFIGLISSFNWVDAQSTSRLDYIENWKGVAIEQMNQHNIPASITLAQGILESGSGNSELAKKGRNHFGIKCHGWEGKKMYLDDDKKSECFRVYKNAENSYEDHSTFLMRYDRYAFLFTYESDDYKSWANGLKKAGYATNPKYPKLLIKIIEDMDLQQYDMMNEPVIITEPSLIVELDKEEDMNKNHTVMMKSNSVKYILVGSGDTFYLISKEFGLSLAQLHRYNSFDNQKDFLEEGDVVYIQPKRRSKLFRKKEVVMNENLSLNAISQLYAVNINSLKRLNDFSSDNVIVSKGEKVTLH